MIQFLKTLFKKTKSLASPTQAFEDPRITVCSGSDCILTTKTNEFISKMSPLEARKTIIHLEAEFIEFVRVHRSDYISSILKDELKYEIQWAVSHNTDDFIETGKVTIELNIPRIIKQRLALHGSSTLITMCEEYPRKLYLFGGYPADKLIDLIVGNGKLNGLVYSLATKLEHPDTKYIGGVVEGYPSPQAVYEVGGKHESI
jgi:hypothetical protein